MISSRHYYNKRFIIFNLSCSWKTVAIDKPVITCIFLCRHQGKEEDKLKSKGRVLEAARPRVSSNPSRALGMVEQLSNSFDMLCLCVCCKISSPATTMNLLKYTCNLDKGLFNVITSQYVSLWLWLMELEKSFGSDIFCINYATYYQSHIFMRWA